MGRSKRALAGYVLAIAASVGAVSATGAQAEPGANGPAASASSSVSAGVGAEPDCHEHDGIFECHESLDTIRMTPQRQADLAAKAKALFNAAPAAVVPGTEHLVGTWDAPVDWSVVGVFLSLLPNGKVLAFDSINDLPTEASTVQNTTRALVWNPADKSYFRYDNSTGSNVFCAGFAKLPDGRVFLAGGNKDAALNGINFTHIFDSTTNTWQRSTNMAFERWYPSVTPLNNGEMLITGGGPATSEVRDVNGAIRQLTNAQRGEWANREYPWLQTAPNGQVAFLGPATSMGYVNPSGSGSYTSTVQRDSQYRSYGSYAMYDAVNGRVLVSGGADTNRSAVVVNLSNNTSAATSVMNFQRRQHNLTVLPDGKVLATGGIAGGGNSLADFNNAVLASEIWDPATGQWTTTADQARPRMYHSASLLLPDGRVMSTGGGICGTCAQIGYLEKNYEIYNPPYLYRKDGSGQLAARPTIVTAPTTVNYNTTFSVNSPEAATITKAALIRLGSVTHSQDMEQRYVPLTFSASGTTLSLNGPANANIAPPGYYMLFILDSNGVPSVSRIVNVAAGSTPPPPPPPPTGTGTGLTGQYFANTTLSGTAALTRTEAVNFNWGTASPGAGIGVDAFSARWVGTIEAPTTGAYQLQTISDDGVRVTFNGSQIINNWTDHGATANTSGTINLTAGTKYAVTMEYYENGGDATARLLWTTPGSTTFVAIPADRLYAGTPPPPPPPSTGTGLRGQYFNGTALSGSPILTRTEAINFNWGANSPGSPVPVNTYSVRWTGTITPATTGTYYLRTVSDDGVRMWLNGTQIINNWTNHAATTNTSTARTLTAGTRYTITVEYFENTGNAVMQMQWRTPGTTTYSTVPASVLRTP